MSALLEILLHWGLGILGVILYVLITLYKNVKQNGVNLSILTQYKKFWVLTLLLHLCIAILLTVVPEAQGLVEGLGFSVEHSKTGYVALGLVLAGGLSNSPIGEKIETKV